MGTSTARKKEAIIGRPKLPEHLKRRLVSIKLPPRLIEFLREKEGSQADLIIDALESTYREDLENFRW